MDGDFVPGAGISAIESRGLTRSFEGKGARVDALGPVDLRIAPGEFVSIVGPSGCGKSTFLYILGGFLQASAGSLLCNGRPITGPGVDRGIVFQEYALFPWLSVADNIAYGLRMKGTPEKELRERVAAAIAMIGLGGFETRFPRELSGGMKQRVALARTFVYEPDILLLDEPFGALDSQTRELMQDELLKLWRASGKTVLMVTHDVAEAVYLSNRVCVMSARPGRVVESFDVALDHAPGREAVMLSDDYRALHDQVWLAVRRQAGAAR